MTYFSPSPAIGGEGGGSGSGGGGLLVNGEGPPSPYPYVHSYRSYSPTKQQSYVKGFGAGGGSIASTGVVEIYYT